MTMFLIRWQSVSCAFQAREKNFSMSCPISGDKVISWKCSWHLLGVMRKGRSLRKSFNVTISSSLALLVVCARDEGWILVTLACQTAILSGESQVLPRRQWWGHCWSCLDPFLAQHFCLCSCKSPVLCHLQCCFLNPLSSWQTSPTLLDVQLLQRVMLRLEQCW